MSQDSAFLIWYISLEDAQYKLRKLAEENRSRESKSLIVELALKMAIEDVEEGAKSKVLKEVLNKGETL